MMASERNETNARRWFLEMWSKPDLSMVDEIISDDYNPEWIQLESTGPEQIKHEIKYIRTVFPDLKYEIIDSISTKDRVWVRYKGTGTQKGDAWGFEPTGKSVEFEGAAILCFNSEGLVIDRWGVFCSYEVFMDLGLVPPYWELSSVLKLV